MLRLRNRSKPQRRGVILILTVVLMIVLLGMLAFSVDLGYVLVAKTQLQTAADSAALAAAATMGSLTANSNENAKTYAGMNNIGNNHVVLKDSDIVYGNWDSTKVGTTTDPFTPSQNGLGNAVKVTARADSTTSGAIPLFFGPILGQNSLSTSASSVATTNPRDICFVVDLSGSMNDDTDPGNADTVNGKFDGTADLMLQDIYNDLGFGEYPGDTRNLGYPLITSNTTPSRGTSYDPVADLCKTSQVPHTTTTQTWDSKKKKWVTTTTTTYTTSYDGPLYYQNSKVPFNYTVTSDESGVSVTKSYQYTVPNQYRVYVDGDGSGQPADDAAHITDKVNKWIIEEQLGGASGQAVPGIGIMKNALPALNCSLANNYGYWKAYFTSNYSKLGFQSYLSALEKKGWDKKPFNQTYLYSPLSHANSPTVCPMHMFSTAAGPKLFPPREMPVHAARVAIVDSLQAIADRNANITDVTQKDRVSIVAYDLTTDVRVIHALDDNYTQAMTDCTTMQPCSDDSSCTATETGLIKAISVLNASPRAKYTNKVVVLLTDGKPNLKTSDYNTVIAPYQTAHKNSNYYSNGSTDACQDAAMMQAAIMISNNWQFFPVEIGIQGDEDFMDRIYSISRGKNTTTISNPYEANSNPLYSADALVNIFNTIISSPKIRIVQ